MKFFGCIEEFNHSWKDVVHSLFQRYPNPFSKHVLTEDVLERYVRDDGKLYTVKMLTKTNPLPRWGERFYKGPKFVTIIEETIVDPIKCEFTSYSRNITMCQFISCTEKCVYTSKDVGRSVIEKRAWLDSTLGYGLRLPVLEFSIQRYKSNQHKATLGLKYALTNRLPLTLGEVVRQKTEHFTETAKNSKKYISKKAKQASDIARLKAKSKAELPKVQASEV